MLYQVFLGEQLFQSQLTTLTEESDGTPRRTRTAQSFTDGVPTTVSFFRERRVTREEFYSQLADTLVAYNILDTDACTTDGFSGAPTGYGGGLADCTIHLEESFDL